MKPTAIAMTVLVLLFLAILISDIIVKSDVEQTLAEIKQEKGNQYARYGYFMIEMGKITHAQGILIDFTVQKMGIIENYFYADSVSLWEFQEYLRGLNERTLRALDLITPSDSTKGGI